MTLNFAVIGLGGLGHIQAQVCADLEGIELVAGVDVSPDSCERFEETFGVATYQQYETLLEEHGDTLDAVTIITPHTVHFEQAMACLDAGVHVHLEKPMVTTTADAETLLERTNETGLVLQIGYQRHFHPGYREIRRIIQSGRIGEVHMAACYLAQEWITLQGGTWRTNPALSGGGQLIDSGSHLLDALLWTTDSRPRRVAAITDNWEYDVDVNSAVSVSLEGPDRPITASIGVSGDGEVFEERLAFWGTDGRLSYEDGELVVVENGTEYVTSIDEPDYMELTVEKLEAFFEAIRTDGESPVSGEFGLRVTRLTEAAFRSSETGQAIDAASLPLEQAESIPEPNQ